MNAGPPAVAKTVLKLLICGSAGLMVYVTGAEVPAEVLAVMLAVPRFSTRLAGMETDNCVGLT